MGADGGGHLGGRKTLSELGEDELSKRRDFML